MTLRERCGRLRAPSGRVLTCRIFENNVDLDVHVTFNGAEVLLSRRTFAIGLARAIAAEWRTVRLASQASRRFSTTSD
jgi:hypothetical protein